MPGRVADILAIAAVATLVTATIAMPVLRAPSERLFGMDSVGRHHDPFTVMQQFERPIGPGVYAQPITDIPGALLSRLSGPVAAYNWVVLLSFPFAAIAGYLLARQLELSPAGAAVAAMAYAFSPFHVAHAAYHPHVAQVQWIPLYLLALWRCLNTASPGAIAILGAATVAVTFSNFYGGFIAAVLTPVAVAAYWIVRRRTDTRSTRRLAATVGALGMFALVGAVYMWSTSGPLMADRAAFTFPRGDLFHYSAKWWSYFVPPVGHPLLGVHARGLWHAVGVEDGILEQQISLGWGIVVLALIAAAWWVIRDRQMPSLTWVPVLVVVAVAAVLCSLSPERTVGTWTFIRPSAVLYAIVPMFRSYARFGVVVQLMAALLAGIGVERLWRAGTTTARVSCVTLVMLAAGEYAVWPPTQWRDVMPTRAHRWVVDQPTHVRVLDCTPLTRESESVRWLTAGRTMLLGGTIDDCTEPYLSTRLAADGYTHLIVRSGTADAWFFDRRLPDGLRPAAHFDDSRVFAVATSVPPIYTAAMTGFSPREHDAERSWRWMGTDATWMVVNSGDRPVLAVLGLDIAAFHTPRRLEVRLDGRPLQTVVIEPTRRTHMFAAVTVDPGGHVLAFHPVDPPTVADEVIHNGDTRPLSFAFGMWTWTVTKVWP